MTSPADDSRFHLELLKLLAQVAWGDGVLETTELRSFERLARRWNLEGEALSPLMEALAAGKGLPPPDLALLRSRRAEVLTSAINFANTDGNTSASEAELVQEIEQLLGA